MHTFIYTYPKGELQGVFAKLLNIRRFLITLRCPRNSDINNRNSQLLRNKVKIVKIETEPDS